MPMNSDPELASASGDWSTFARPAAEFEASTGSDEYGPTVTEPAWTGRPPCRTATVSQTADGQPLPIAIVVGPDELNKLGVDPEQASEIKYRVTSEQIHLWSEHHDD